MERKVWLASEGMRCSGVIVIPDDHQPGERRAALVLCGGYGAVKQMVLPEAARHLARAGYVSLAIDYRYFGESEGDPRSQLLPAAQVEDVRNAISFLQQQPEVDPDRIALWGVHLGGGVALHAAAADRRVRCVVAQSPVADGRRWMRGLRSPSRWERLLERLQQDRLNRSHSGYSEYVTAIAADGFCAMPGDDEAVAWIDACYAATPTLRRQITLRSVEAIVEWRPEAMFGQIAPRPALIVALDRDTLVPPEEAVHAFERLGQPRRLLWLTEQNARHHTHLLAGAGLAAAVSAAADFLSDHLPALPRGIVEAAAAAEPDPQPQAGDDARDSAQDGADADDAQPQAEDGGAGAAGESAAAAEPDPQPEPGDGAQDDASAGDGQPQAEDGGAAGESAAAAEPDPQPEPGDGAQAEASADDAPAVDGQPQAEDGGAAGESAAAAEPEPQPEPGDGAQDDAQDGAPAGDDQPQAEDAGAAGESAAAAEPEPQPQPGDARDETAAAAELRGAAESAAAGEPEPQPPAGTGGWQGETPAAAPEFRATVETAAATEREAAPDGEPREDPEGAAPGAGPDESAATAEAIPVMGMAGAEVETGMAGDLATGDTVVGDPEAGDPLAGDPEAAPMEERSQPEPMPESGMEAHEPPLAAAAEPEPATGQDGSDRDGAATPHPWQPPAETRPWWDRPLNTTD